MAYRIFPECVSICIIQQQSFRVISGDPDPNLLLDLIGISMLFHGLQYDNVIEFRQPIQVQSHLEMQGILVQLGHIQRT